MRTVPLCPFSIGTLLWQSQDGGWTLTAVVRGTFSLVQGREALLADVQDPVYGGADELVPLKVHTDVLLTGSAFAPHGEALDAFVARLSVKGPSGLLLDKSIGVVGDRVWIEGPDGFEPSAPRPVYSVPLQAERAERGPDNPVGFDLTRAPVVGALALPNLEAIDDASPGGGVTGPLLPRARSRRSALKSDGWAWATEPPALTSDVGPCLAHGAMPKGFDLSFFNTAPVDQRVDALPLGASLRFENLHREHALFEALLPHVKAKVFLVSPDLDHGVEIAMRCDTVWIDTDRGVVTLTWRGLASVSAPRSDALGLLVVAAEPKGRELRYEHIQKILMEGTSVSLDEESFAEITRPLTGDTIRERIVLPAALYEDPPRAIPIVAQAQRGGASPLSGPAAHVPADYEELSPDDLIESTTTTSSITIQRLGVRLPEDTFADEPPLMGGHDEPEE